MQLKFLIVLLLCLAGSRFCLGQNYYVYVTAESEDEVALIRFDGEKATTVKTIPVGIKPTEIEGPHGITVSPDGKYWFLSLAHGNPFGYLVKYETGTDRAVGETTLGLFPASMQISEASGLLFCVNFNLHGDMVPSTLSVVEPQTMSELKRIPVGIMPHGSRISPDGTRQYTVGMMSGELFEINTLTLEVSRVLNLDTNEPLHAQQDKVIAEHENHHASHTMNDRAAHQHSAIKPTWVMPHPDGKRVYVAANGSDEILEIDLPAWKITRRLPCGKGPYNVDVTPDGTKLIVSYKSEGSTGIWDLVNYKELANIPNTRKVTHGVAVSPDSKYAFISVEGIGGESGTMDVIDLNTLQRVATAELGKQAGGIAFWKME